MEPYAGRRIYTFCIRQPTSQHPVGSSLVIPKSPQRHMRATVVKMCKRYENCETI